jgi:general secretion pathway protein D
VTIENRPTCHRASCWRCRVLALWLLAAPSATYAQAQVAQGAITPNYKDADLSQIIEAVSAVTGKNFIVDPRVQAQVRCCPRRR